MNKFESELEYLREYIPRTFGTPINNEELKAQLSEMIKEKIEGYIYQRLRDWPAPHLFELIASIDKPKEVIPEPAVEPKRTRKPKEVNGTAKA